MSTEREDSTLSLRRRLPLAGPTIASIADVVDKQLCLGCGACAYLQPDAFEMVDVADVGRRPLLRAGVDETMAGSEDALAVCPGAAMKQPATREDGRWSPAVFDAWGPVLETWEGHASDPEIRFEGSSGGAATALALHGLTAEHMHGVLHIAAQPDLPYLNHTVMSRTRNALLEATGSRYAPASPCDRLDLIERAPAPCVFIGKPCDVAALEQARRLRPRLDRNVGLTIAIFCAGTPSTRGTLEMLRVMGIEDPRSVRSVRYRGRGWPGDAEVVTGHGSTTDRRRLTYEESWGAVLQRHRPWRCHVCADHTGEFADIAVGDPWYRDIQPGEPGRSLVIARTERGRQFLHRAITAAQLDLQLVDDEVLWASQPNLLRARGAVWGRVFTSRLFRVAHPRYSNMPVFRVWWKVLNVRQKAQSIYGTIKRIFTRRLYRRRRVAAGRET